MRPVDSENAISNFEHRLKRRFAAMLIADGLGTAALTVTLLQLLR